MTTLKIFTKCNQKCVFCQTQEDFFLGKRTESTYGEIKNEIMNISKTDKTILLTGGCEPTMIEGLPNLIKFANNQGIKDFGIETNAIKLSSKKYTQDLIEAGLTYCCVSLHSHIEEISDEITQGPGTFNKTIQGLKNLQEAKIPIFMQHTITSLNYKSLLHFIKFLESNFPNIKELTFSFIRPIRDDRKSEGMTPKLSDIEPFIHETFSYLKNNNYKFHTVTGLGIPYCFLNNFMENSAELMVYTSKGKKIFDELTYQDEKTKGPQCKACSMEQMCSGVTKNYAKLHGLNELVPIFKKPSKRNFNSMVEPVSMKLTSDTKCAGDDVMNNAETEYMKNLSGDVLDVGCGYLYFFKFYEEGIINGRIKSVYCLDPNPSINLLRQRVPIDIRNKFSFKIGKLEHFDLSKKFDRIIIRYVINHLSDKKSCVSKLKRLLKPGGKLYLLENVVKHSISKKPSRLSKTNSERYRKIYQNLKFHINKYKRYLSHDDYVRFENDMVKYYCNEHTDRYYTADQIVSFFKDSALNLDHQISGHAYDENTLQLVISKKW